MVKDPICGMDVNPKSALSLQKGNDHFYFCSAHCLKKFSQEHHLDIPGTPDSGDSCHVSRPGLWYLHKTFLVAGVLGVLICLSYFVLILEPFRRMLLMYFGSVWWAILLGLTIGGIIDYYVPRECISRYLAGPERESIFRAVFLGFFMSICSCGILALAIQLYKKGASPAAVVAFLLASPWANLPLTLMLIGFFGVSRALFIVFTAIVVALVTGLLFQILEARNIVETNPHSLPTEKGYSLFADLKKRREGIPFTLSQIGKDIRGIFSGIVSLSDMVLWWILIGIGLASLSGAYIPSEIFREYMGPTFGGMAVTLAVATVLEVCSEGTAPLAFEIFRQTSAFGNSLVFLMAGVATDYTEIGLLWHNIGRRTAIWLPLLTVPQIIFWGFLANLIF